MINKENALIERLKLGQAVPSPYTYSWYSQQVNPPVTQEELERAERLLGFALPSVLKRIYLEVGNGGFGPSYGLFKLSDESQKYDFKVGLMAKWHSIGSLRKRSPFQVRATLL